MESINEIIKKDSKKNIFYDFIHWQNNRVLNKIILIYKYLFNIVTIRNFGNKQIYILPWKKEKNKKIGNRKISKLYKKISSRVTNDNLVVLSDAINEDERILGIVYKNRLKVLDGKWLFSILLQDTTKYIVECQKKELKNQIITILINRPNDIVLASLKSLAKEIKLLKIVTTNSKYFKKVENQLYNELGIPILIVNNRKKSLLNSDIIINIDFSEKEINQYNINRKSIIINVNDNININLKGFSGININGYKIKVDNQIIDLLKEYNLYNQFDINTLYESLIYSREKFDKLKNSICEDNVKIEYLIGTKGKINEMEYLS